MGYAQLAVLRLGQMLSKERQCALKRQPGTRSVMRSPLIAIEAMLGGIDVNGGLWIRLLQRGHAVHGDVIIVV
jgi:hypothetical protein